MRLLDYLTGLVSLLALPFIAWWGVNQSPQSAMLLEARLEANAHQALQLAGLDWAGVEMDGQTALLTGAAPSADATDDAVRAVLLSSGRGGLLFGGVSQVKTQVYAADPVRPYLWTAEKLKDGSLVLSGHVPSKAVRASLMLEAEAVSERPVRDRMQVASGTPDGNWEGIARLAVLQVSDLDSGRAVLEDHVLTLRGAALNDTVRERLTGSTGAIAAPFRGVALIEGVPLWFARHEGGSLILSGAVSSEADRRALLAVLRRTFRGDVRDEMVVAEVTAGGWIEGAKAGLSHFAMFTSGQMAFDPAVNGFTFEGEAPASTLQFLSDDMARAAGEWRFVIVAEAELVAAETSSAAALVAGSAATCTDNLNQMLASAAVGFVPGRAEFRREDAPALDALAAIARNCGDGEDLVLAINGDALNEARAAALADYLERAGAPRPRLAAIGYGPASGGRVMDTDAVSPSERPLEFTIRE